MKTIFVAVVGGGVVSNVGTDSQVEVRVTCFKDTQLRYIRSGLCVHVQVHKRTLKCADFLIVMSLLASYVAQLGKSHLCL